MSGPRHRETTVRDLLPKDVIVHRLHVGTKKEALTELLNTLVIQAGVADLSREREFRDALFEREAVASTGIGGGLAIPHVKSRYAEKMALVAGLSEEGIDWGAHDGQPVRLVLMWACPPSQTQDHLALMRALATLAKDPDDVARVVACRDRKQFLKVLSEFPVEPKK